jgi:hypothetical protein
MVFAFDQPVKVVDDILMLREAKVFEVFALKQSSS